MSPFVPFCPYLSGQSAVPARQYGPFVRFYYDLLPQFKCDLGHTPQDVLVCMVESDIGPFSPCILGGCHGVGTIGPTARG